MLRLVTWPCTSIWNDVLLVFQLIVLCFLRLQDSGNSVCRICRWTELNCMSRWIRRVPAVALILRRRNVRTTWILKTGSGRTIKEGVCCVLVNHKGRCVLIPWYYYLCMSADFVTSVTLLIDRKCICKSTVTTVSLVQHDSMVAGYFSVGNTLIITGGMLPWKPKGKVAQRTTFEKFLTQHISMLSPSQEHCHSLVVCRCCLGDTEDTLPVKFYHSHSLLLLFTESQSLCVLLTYFWHIVDENHKQIRLFASS